MDNLLLLLERGGPALWMLAFCLGILCWVGLEKFSLYRKISAPSPLSWENIREGKRREDCPNLAYRLMTGRAELKNPEKKGLFFEDFMLKAEKELSGGLPVLATISVISPFIGLFGTVLGIMRAFFQVAQKGNMSPAVVGGGIAEALVATALGLLVAVLSVILYNWFKVLRDKTLEDLEILSNRLDLSE